MTKRVRHTLKKPLRYAGYARWGRASIALIVLISLCIPALSGINDLKSYALSPEVEKVLGAANKNLSAKFSFDDKNNKWQFNKNGTAALASAIAKQQGDKDVEGVAGALSKVMAQQVGGGGEKDNSLYSVDLSVRAADGIVYYDNQTNISFKMIPSFPARDGKMVNGRIVYPFADGGQIVYTAKANGLKEDIVLSKYIGDTLRYGYKLELPQSLEARLSEDGSIGIYSADPQLFGNINFGSDEDKARIMDARKNAPKNHLMFGIPAPFIKDQTGKKGHTRYILEDNHLTVVASGLKGLKYPLAVDPSVLITSSSDFLTGNSESMIEFGTNEVKRGGLTGGTINTWHFTDNSVDRGTTQNGGSGAANGMITARNAHQTVTYNGYIYALAGDNQGSNVNTVERAPINSDGTLGTWVASGTLPEARADHVSFAYNGYMYVVGGYTGGGSYSTDVKVATISTSDGSLGTWTSTTSLPAGRLHHAALAYNGMMYVINGCTTAAGNCNTANPTAVVYCASILATGQVGTWNTCNSTNLTRRDGFSAVAYNGYIYGVGGCETYAIFACTSQPRYVQYAKVNSDGSLGNWATSTTLFTVDRGQPNLVINNGYLYLTGDSGVDYVNDILYAPIYANGSVGEWQATASYVQTRNLGSLNVYKNYLYIVGGCTVRNAGQCSNTRNDVQFSKINTAGATGNYSTAANYDSTARSSFASVVYNNYLYIIGGSTGITGGRSDMLNTARYAPINADGSVGTWSTSSSGFNQVNSGSGSQTCTSQAVCPGRVNMAAGVHNGYLYIAGGVSNGTADQWSDVQSAVICTGVNAPVAGCAGAGDLRNWNTLYKDYLTNSTSTYTEANGRAQVAMQIYNGVMYLIGGHNSAAAGTQYSDIYYATLTDTGGVNSFTASSVSLPSARAAVKTFVHSGKLYIVGGGQGSGWASTSNEVNDIQFIPINPNGTLDGTTGWKDANAAINGGSGSSFAAASAINDYGVSVSNGQIYVVGGRDNGTGAFATVYRAAINANGSVGSWTTTQSITTVRYGLKAVTVKGFLYVIGGCTQHSIVFGQNCTSTGNMLSDYQYARINNGGTGAPVSWASANTFTGARYYHSTVAANGYLYVIGGCTAFTAGPGCTAVATDYSYAPINTDGSLGSWTQVTSALPNAVYNAGSVVVNGYVYLIGGCGAGACSTYRNIVQYAPINTNGTLGAWGSPGTGGTFDGSMAGRWGTSSTYYDGYIYTVGGAGSGGSLNDVWSTQVNSNGTLGAWQSAGSGFTTARMVPGAIAHKGYLYVIGGHSDVFLTSVYDDIQFRPIGSSGTLSGSWTNTRNFPEAAGAINVTAYNGYMYLSGGYTSPSTATSATRYAAISASGHLGVWQTASGYGTSRAATGGTIYNGYMYATGGYSGTPFSSVDYAPIQVLSRIGSYSKLVQVNSAVEVSDVFYNGSLGYGSTVQYKVAPSSGVFSGSSTASQGAGAEPTPKCGTGTIYYVQISVKMDDSFSATFGESSESAVTDVTVYYRTNATPPPNLRLNGGKWFYTESQQPLDICRD